MFGVLNDSLTNLWSFVLRTGGCHETSSPLCVSRGSLNCKAKFFKPCTRSLLLRGSVHKAVGKAQAQTTLSNSADKSSSTRLPIVLKAQIRDTIVASIPSDLVTLQAPSPQKESSSTAAGNSSS